MYGRGYTMGFGPPVTPPIVKNLLIVNAAVFALQLFADSRDLIRFGAIAPYRLWNEGWFWQPFTYMWLHANLMHVLGNMFMLWMFGSQVALAWGPRRFLRFYLLCGVGAGLIIAAYPYLRSWVGLAADPTIPTLGASGAVYGVLLAYSLTWPDRTIMLIFPPVAFRAIWLIPALFVLTYLSLRHQNVSHVGHLGGVLVAWLYLRRHGQTARLLSLEQLRYRWRRYRMRRKLRAVRHEEFEARRRRDDERRLH